MIKNHENITLFHYSGCYHILFETHGYFLYLKLMVNLFSRNIGGHYLKAQYIYIYIYIIYKIIHGKNYEKLYKLLFKTHGN